MRAIIPAAGFGTRMGMRPDQSKELLTYMGKCLIDHAMDLCEIYNLTAHVIVREEKQDLIAHVFHRAKIQIQVIEPKGEWYDTILQSKRYWEDNNILILPDTTFNWSAIQEMREHLELGSQAVFATHAVKDGSNWGTIKDYHLCEKDPSATHAIAWGLIGFKKEYGEELFTSMREKKPFKLKNSSFVSLDYFEDVTRGPSSSKP